MTEKKTTRKTTSTRRRAKTVPSTELKGSESALLDALRSNMSLLGELAARYEVSIRPDAPEDPPSIGSPHDVYRLLGPEMSVAGPGAAARSAARQQEPGAGSARRIPGECKFVDGPGG